jgi:hypothetical protein
VTSKCLSQQKSCFIKVDREMAEDAALAAALKAYADVLGDAQSSSLTTPMPQLPLHLTNEAAPFQISLEEHASVMFTERLRPHPNHHPIDVFRQGGSASLDPQQALPMNELLMQELMLSEGQFTDEAQQMLSYLEQQYHQQQRVVPSFQEERRRSDKHYFTIALDGAFLIPSLFKL